ncbi:MAG: TMEM43 family protein [Treponemataceae bacterium]|nr:TMEM43 family protein [Treponemataceae bacterium]
MEISKGKIILFVVVVYFAIMGIKNTNKDKSLNADLLKEVTVVSDGKINPANDGKLVLVAGKISFDGSIIFEELDEGFNSFKVTRKVKDFVTYERENGKKGYEWKERTEADPNASELIDFVYSTEKTLTPNVGEFVLDDFGLSLVKTNQYFNKQESICGLKWTGLNYGNPAHKDEDEVGDVNISYDFYDVDAHPYLSVLAVQSGNTFKPYVVGKKQQVYNVYPEKIDTVEKLKEQLALQVKSNTRGKILFILLIVAVGALLIVDSKKNSGKSESKPKQETENK